MLNSAGFTWVPEALAIAGIVLLAYRYFTKRNARWRRIIGRAAEYHRFHLLAIRNDEGVNAPSRDLAYAMLMVVDRQFGEDLKGSPGFFGVIRAHLGEKSSLASLNEIFEKLYRDKAFLGNSEIDDRLERLFNTMTSMIYRYHMLTSVFGLLALLYMDLILFLAAVHLDRRGSSRLFRDIAGNRP